VENNDIPANNPIGIIYA